MKNILALALLITSTLAFSADYSFETKSESSFTPEFNNRFTIIAGLNPTIYRSQDVISLQGSYGRKMSNSSWGDSLWADFSIQQTTGIFRDLAENNSNATGVATTELEATKESVQMIALGLQYRTHYASTLLPLNLYETSTASAMYGMMKEDLGAKTFSGPGLKAKFSLMKPLNDYCHVGFNFDYNLLTLKRGKEDSDTITTGSSRSLTLSWLTIGLDFSLFL